ncbi:17859_t:CDS:2 [Gigaspora margarita]|uniref:17859_t:CDS:1 n=1 Tax=Gigaspora margarita TaxID=4874 RepID=A0ABN7WJS2_GIGMA|nr:17859_t:CDS:2 [Gigaspora margarita]
MYNEESSRNINNNQSMEWTVGFTQDQTNINLFNIYNNPSIEWSADFTQDYEDQSNNSLSTEWFIDLTQDQTNISLLNVYSNPYIKWSAGDQTNNNLPIEWSTDFINNNLFMKWNTDVTQNDENQTNYNLSMEWTACSTQNQTNTSLLNTYNAGITQHREEQINFTTTKSVQKNEHPTSLVSRHKKHLIYRCKKCNFLKCHYDKTSNQCKGCYRASLRVLSDNKLIDDFIESTQTHRYCKNRTKLEFIPNVKLNWAINELNELIVKAEKGEINFPENEYTNIIQTKINDQAIYSSRLLTPLISKALTLQSMKLSSTDIMRQLNNNQTDDDSKAIDFDINKL